MLAQPDPQHNKMEGFSGGALFVEGNAVVLSKLQTIEA
ncbi:hypothetical protein MCP1_9520002 [Candidatus Terasakiella magnetica]|nr:hypothetical protein MCP1_9520002 [Candidatus Terasakiella magnetica]